MTTSNFINLRLDDTGKAVITDSTGEPLHGVSSVLLRIDNDNPKPQAVLTLSAVDVIANGVPAGIDRDQLVRDMVALNSGLQQQLQTIMRVNASVMDTHTNLSAQAAKLTAEVAKLTAERDALQTQNAAITEALNIAGISIVKVPKQ